MLDMRPHEEGNYLPFDEDRLLAAQSNRQTHTDALLTELAHVVQEADMPWAERLRLLHAISWLRGYVHAHSRRLLAETQGRCN